METLQFKRVMRGYDPEEVDKAWAELQHNLAELNAANRELRLQINSLREQNQEWGNRLKNYEKMEKDLRDAMLSAQRVANQVREEAERESQQLLEQARLEAEALQNEMKMQTEKEVEELLQAKEQAQVELHELLERIADLSGQKEELEGRIEKAIAQLELLRKILFE